MLRKPFCCVFLSDDWMNTVHKKLSIAPSDIHGLGCFADEHVDRGEVIVECEGPVVERPAPPGDRWYGYYVKLGEKRWLAPVGDGDPEKDPSNRMNHSCEPNAELKVMDGLRVWILALRSIQVGEEVTLDYGNLIPPGDSYGFVCGCRSANCRRWIGGRTL